MTEAPEDPERASDDTGEQSAATSEADTDDAPLSDLARRVSDRRREREAEASTPESRDLGTGTERASGGDSEDPFRQMSVAEIDEESLWSSLESDAEPTVSVGPPESAGAAGADPERAGATSDPDEDVVAKADYCQKCPYLHEPPELACTHDGTEIVAVEDANHFRVRNCPMVDE